MKWTVKLVAEVVDDKQIEHEIATIERADGIGVLATIRDRMGHLEICPIHTTPGASSNVIAFQQLRCLS
jgi:hypothetical protein